MMSGDQVADLLNGRRQGDGWMACCPAHDDRNPSLFISEKGGKTLLYCHAGCSQNDVLTRILALGVDLGFGKPIRDQNVQSISRIAEILREASPLSGVPNGPHDDLVHRYIKSRGLSIPSGCEHSLFVRELEVDGELKTALIGKVVAQDSTLLGIQRIFLGDDGKKFGENPKRALGRIRGGAIRLGSPLVPDELNLTEGIETALAILEATKKPVWACVSSGGLKGFQLPSGVRAVNIWADRDPSRTGEDAAEHLARKIYENSRGSVGIRILVPPLPPSEARGSCDWLDVLNHNGPIAISSAPEMQPVYDGPPPILKLRKVGDPNPLPKIEFLVEDLLPLPGLSLLSARPKTGKSTLSRQLAACVVNGDSFFGRAVKVGKVLYLGLEDHPGFIDEQLQGLCRKDSQENIHFLVQAPAEVGKIVEGIGQALDKNRYLIVIVDTLIKASPVKEWNDYGETTQRIDEFRRLANQYRCHILFVHHHSKSAEKRGEQGVLGSTGISASVDTILVMDRCNERHSSTLCSDRLRYGRELEEVELVLEKQTGRLSAGLAGSELQQLEIQGKVLACLEHQSEPMNRTSLRELVGCKTESLDRALQSLHSQGRVVVTGTGLKGDRKLYAVTSLS
jgi:putative DNA primase/helicase